MYMYLLLIQSHIRSHPLIIFFYGYLCFFYSFNMRLCLDPPYYFVSNPPLHQQGHPDDSPFE